MFRSLIFAFWGSVVCTFIIGGKALCQVAENPSGRSVMEMSKDTATVGSLIRASVKLHNDPDSAIHLLEQAFNISKQIGYADGCAKSLLGVGTHYFNKGELEKAKIVFRQAYPYCQASNLHKNQLLLQWYNNMASPYAVQGIADTASFYYYKALDNISNTEPQKRDSNMYAVILANIAVVWQNAGEYKQALYYSNKCLEIAIRKNDSDRIADIYLNTGIVQNAMGDTIASIKSIRSANDIYLKRKKFASVEMSCCAMALNSSSADSALHYFQLALDISKQTKIEPLYKIYTGLGQTYLRLKNYDKAKQYLNQALARATALNYTTDRGAIYNWLAETYTATREFELANKYQKAYSDLHDSLINKEKIQTANNLEIKYRTAEKDKEIAAARLKILERENKLSQKNSWIILICGIVLLLVVIFISFYINTRRKERLKQQELLNINQQQQIGNLKSVMMGEEKERTRIARELHDGIMVQLAVIKMKLRKMRLMPQQDDEEPIDTILDQLDKTSRELRQTAHNLMPDMLLETGLNDAIFYHCNSLKKETGLNIIFQHYGSLPALQQETELYLYRIVQELLQNIIKHAHANKALVQLNYHPPLLSIAVEDDGVGFDKNVIDVGMGLKSIYSRLHVLNGIIDIKSNKLAGTTVFIELNIDLFIKQKTADNANTSSHSR